MVLTVLKDASSGGLAKAGRLRKHGHRYKLLNGHAG
jgi:hypothetical protein